MSIPPLRSSQINIPVIVAKTILNETINQIIQTNIAEGITLEDGFKCIIKLNHEIDFQATQNNLVTTLPLDIEFYPNADISAIKAYGSLEVTMETAFQIFQNKLLSKTEVIHQRWLKSPKLKLFGISIPVENISDQFIKKYKSEICYSIDETIQKEVQLPTYVEKIKTYLNGPLYSTEDSILNFYSSVQEIGIGPMKMEGDHLRFHIYISAESIISETRSTDLDNPLNFQILPYVDDKSLITLQSRIPLIYLEQLLREQTQDQVFGSGLSKITISKIKFGGQYEELKILLNISGKLDGNYELSFTPEFNKGNKKIELKHLKLKYLEKKKIDKAVFSLISRIAESKLKNIIEDQLNLILSDFVKSTESILSGFEISPGIVLKGELLDYQINSFQIIEPKMYFNVNAEMKTKIEISKINLKN